MNKAVGLTDIGLCNDNHLVMETSQRVGIGEDHKASSPDTVNELGFRRSCGEMIKPLMYKGQAAAISIWLLSRSLP